jgi:RimJ/RimL family protein N-acetyltransferase
MTRQPGPRIRIRAPASLPIETARLLIRPLEIGDAAPLAAIWSDPLVTVHLGGPRDAATVRRQLEDEVRASVVRPYTLWPVVEKATGQVIADCGLIEKDVDGRREIELVYVLAASAWRRGFATEAAAAIRDYALQTLRLRRLIALIDPENVASARVAEKVGMRLERETQRPGGKRMRVYAVESPGLPAEEP